MEKKFEWTDELVLKFAKFTYVDSPTFQGRYTDLDQFKFSHSSAKEEVGWEIVEYFNANNRHHPPSEDCKKSGCTIHSVRRKSDGVVFTVGDWVDSTWKIQKIQSFETHSDGDLIVSFSTCKNPFSKIKALPQRTKPERNGSLSREMEMLEERIAYIEKKLNIEG